jgi:ketosteroid isomerase-like protein
MNPLDLSPDEAAIGSILEAWTKATREGRQEDVLKNHADQVLIFDVLPPMQYSSAAQYRASWDEWQPQVQDEMCFALEELQIVASPEVAFAHGILRCGGTLPNGKTFQDRVRATFCFSMKTGSWQIVHQHISKPIEHD